LKRRAAHQLSAAERDSRYRRASRHPARDHVRDMGFGTVQERRDLRERQQTEII